MDSRDQQLPQSTIVPASHKKQWIFIILLVAILSGICGYLIGVSTSKSSRGQLTSQISPTILLPTPTTMFRTTPTMEQQTTIPLSSPTSGIYTSQKYQYQMTYANALVNVCGVGGLDSGEQQDFALSYGKAAPNSDNCGDYVITIFIDNTPNKTIDQKVNNVVSSMNQLWGDSKFVKTITTIGGAQAVTLNFSSSQKNFYIFRNPKTSILYDIYVFGDKSQTYQSDIMSTISTFKFTQ